MEEIFYTAAVREFVKQLLSQNPSGRPTAVLLIIFIIVSVLLYRQSSLPDCLSIQEQKSEIAVNMHPICEAGYCDNPLFREFTNSIIHAASQCNNGAVHEPKDDSISEHARRPIYRRLLFT